MADDDDHLQQWLRDDFGRLYDVMFGRLVGYFHNLGFDAATAEDLAHETLVRALKHRATFDPTRGVKVVTWIFRIAHNVGVDEMRRRGRKGTSPLDPSEDRGPAQHRELPADLKAAYEEAKARLPQELREVFVLRREMGFSGKETALILDISESEVSKRLTAAQAALYRDLFGTDPSGPKEMR